MRLMHMRGVRVRGRVVSVVAPSGSAAGSIVMAPIGIGGQLGSRRALERRIENPDGLFEFTDVLPGRYQVVATVNSIDPRRASLTAAQIVDVRDADITGIQLTPTARRNLTGRLILPEGRNASSGLLVVLRSRHPGDWDAIMSEAKGDGSFDLGEVSAGEYDLMLQAMSRERAEGIDDLYIASIRAGDDDVLANGLRVGAQPTPRLEIEVKGNGGALEVVVADDKDAPVPAAMVLLQPDPPRDRQRALDGNCKTGPDGKCRMTGIAPGAYHCYALAGEDIDIDARDPEALKPFEKFGKGVHVDEGERKRIDLIAVSPE